MKAHVAAATVLSALVPGVGLAADLPSRKAAPVDYLRVCSISDVTGFVVPGSDTCLKIGGRVRAEYLYAQPFTREANATTFRGRGYLTLDAMTATDYGPLRATTRVYITRETGRLTASSGIPASIRVANGTDANVTLDWAYLQFAGVTAGRIATSFFEFAPFSGLSWDGGGSLGRGADYGSINALAYTATFGPFAATMSFEDGTERRVGVDRSFSDGFSPTYGGHALPDVVWRLDYTESWGTAMLAGAVHQTRLGSPGTMMTAVSVDSTTGVLSQVSGYGNSFTKGAVGDTAYGFAVQGGVKVNLPMLAPGDAVFLQAAYATGANSYTGWGGTGVGTVSPSTFDVIYDAAGKAKLSNSTSFTGGLQHYWTPTVRQAAFAAYGKLDQFGAGNDTAALSLGSNLIWSPVKNLDIGAEVVYAKLTETPNSFLPLEPGSHRDNWSGRIRFERDF